jgi:hypothetical protein
LISVGGFDIVEDLICAPAPAGLKRNPANRGNVMSLDFLRSAPG